MKNNTYFSRQHIFRWLLLCWLLVPWALQAQSARITWSSQVGCQEYRGEKGGTDDNGTTYSFINSSQCLRVCENSWVTYTVSGQNISYVQWTISGGTATYSGPGNAQANVNWGSTGSGAVQAVITYTDGTVENQNICIEKINSPVAKFEMLNLEYKVCRNTTIYFDNTSYQNGGSDIVNYFWEFGDGTTSTAFEPSHAYADPGTYTVMLTVTNKCGCSSSYKRELEVIKSNPVQINCASVVCEGSTEKYNVQDGCKGEWNVVGGTIVGQNGNEIEVKWDQVDPADGFGYVMYKSECGCPEWTTIKIPVILNKGQIKGEPVICINKQYTYSVPQWPTTSVKWTVTGGQLDYNQQRNEVLFTAYQPGTYTLTADYFNTLLSCKGQATFTIVAEQPVTISGGTDEICVGTVQTFNAVPNVPVIWKVSSGSSVYTSPPMSGPFSYNFVTGGSYTVTATKNGGGCESNAILVKVLQAPMPPAGPISGDNKVCPGKPYVYKLNSPIDPGTVPVWEVTNGTIQGSNTGSSVTVIFNSGAPQYVVSVRNRLANSTAGCVSAPISFNVTPLDLNTITINPNPGPFCPSSMQSFSANLNGITPDSMSWSLGNTNYGSIVSGQGTPNISVNFNEVSSSIPTTLNLRIIKCGVIKDLSIPISVLTLPTVSFNVGNICLGGNLNFSVNQGTITSATSVTFTFANGSTATVPFNPAGTYSIVNNGNIQNNTGNNISQTVTVTYTGTNGCNYKPTASANFIIYPETIITISPVYNIAVCDPATMAPYTLTANSSTGLTNTNGWQWYRNGVQIPNANTNVYTISGPNALGTYKVRATDQNTCVVYSQEVKVIQSCPTGGNCTLNPQINFTPQWTACNTISVTNLSYVGTPDEIQWVTDNVLTLVSPQGGSTATYQTSLAGAHIVFVRLRYGSCWYSRGIEVRKNYEPKFNISQVCNGSAYNVTLYNTSTIFDITAPITYTFSLAGQPDQIGQTATYNNLAPGTYTFTMKMVAAGLPQCITTQTITLAAPPTLNFTLPTSACSGEPINLTVPGYNSANTYTWFFGNNSIVASGATTPISIVPTGTTNIWFRVRTPQGCTYDSPIKGIGITSANFSGTLLPPVAVACVGNAPTITFVPSGQAPASYIWMNGAQQVAGAPNSASFTPTQSGYYWPVLIASNGCKTESMSTQPLSVTLKALPYVNISGKANICAGSSVTLSGIVTDNTLEYQWRKGGTVVVPWVASSSAPIVYNTGALAVGTYVYTLEVRTPGAAGCTSSKNFTVTVSSPPPAVTISYSLQSCQPYEVKLTASGSAAGDYNWSNGMVGQSIVVNEGGAYQVTYTAPSGCKVTGNVQVPLSLESLMWVFPTGCYDECYRKSYVIGPKGIFDHHEWQYFGSSIQSGNNSFINPLYLGSSGTYNLQINHFGCQYTSGALNYFPGKECGVTTDCKLEGDVYMKWDKDHFNIHGILHNSAGQAITLTVSSANGFGVYIPSMITIPAGGSYDMNANPLVFYPNANYPGWEEILFSNETCKFSTKMEGGIWMKGGAGTERSMAVTSASSLKITPNPAKENVKISYNTGSEKLQAKQITVFDAMGNVKFRKELKASSGEVGVEVSSWLQGVYIVIVQTGDTSLQGKLIKN